MEGCIEVRATNKPERQVTLFIKGNTLVAKCDISIDGDNKSVYWYDCDDHVHRDGDLPAAIGYKIVDGKEIVTEEHWYQHGNKNRAGDQPASIYHEVVNGVAVLTGRYWYKNGQYHRDGDQPAEEHRRIVNGIAVLTFQGWRKNGKYHREGKKPARITYGNDGKVKSEEYNIDGIPQPKPAPTIAERLAKIRKHMAAIEAEIAAKSAQ